MMASNKSFTLIVFLLLLATFLPLRATAGDATSLPDQAILSGKLWEEYCEIIKRAGQQLLRPETPHTAFDQAEGMRYLSRLVRAGLELMVEANDPEFPVFTVGSHETIKIGNDNPDNYYLTARISGNNEYRISGTRGNVATLNFSTKGGGYDKDKPNLRGTGALNTSEIQVDPDGHFEVIVSRTRPASGNWLPMAEDTNSMIVRQTFSDRLKETPAKLKIERLGSGMQAPPPLDPVKFGKDLINAAHFTENTARLFADWSRDFKQGHYNRIPITDQAAFQLAGGDPNIKYYYGYLELKDDEALVIDVQNLPESEFWNFQLSNYWEESLDYRYHRIHLNSHNARYNPDGSVRIVVAQRDPGVSNWLTTAGHTVEIGLFRLIGAKSEGIKISSRVVKIVDVLKLTSH